MQETKIVDEFISKLEKLFGADDMEKIKHALSYASFKHSSQVRESGEPYIVHPIAVAEILLEYGIDAGMICAALLHDVLEDTDTKLSELKSLFGGEVAELVNGVSRVKTLRYKSSSENENTESLRKMFVAMAKDIRVIMIKLADRLNNMRTLGNMSAEHQVRKSLDTRDVYIPIAERLGLGKIKGELEDLCFMYLYPTEYAEISKLLDRTLEKHSKDLEEVNKKLKEMLVEVGIEGEVKSRIKRIYSVYKKSQAKGMESIYDLLAHRIIVDTVKDCYFCLGQIHNYWKPVPGRIKDYIAAPKKNGYQSLHTTLLTEEGMPFEVQIRTKEMHRVCEYGLAAHWQYKGGIDKASDLDKKLSFLRQILEEAKDIADTKTFLDIAKTDFYTNEIFVFTPKNKVVQLTENSTPIDFAYAIHSDLGNKCTGAKINGKMCGLTTKLKNGDIVEIITSPTSKGPSRDWLKLAQTASARQKIKSFFKKEMKEENIHLGKEMLEIEAKRKNENLTEILANEKAVQKVLSHRNFLDVDDLFASIGYGGVTASLVLSHLTNEIRADEKQSQRAKRALAKPTKTKSVGVEVKGASDVYIRLAGCCHPIPNDDIIGFVTIGSGIAVHRADCPNIRKNNGERLVKVHWSEDLRASSYNATIVILAEDKHLIINSITFALGSIPGVSLTGISAQTNKGKAHITLQVQLSNIGQINEIVNKLGTIDGVQSVFRK